ncbi:MAG: helix-turn-helix transcriptional regulator [Alphaproteobacteria bacterium]|nr:helix-turn-helix transcriptional regulator [Alphaproteobacteria bacterium]
MITAELVMSLGRDDFFQQFNRALGRILPVDHITLFSYDHDFIPRFIAGASRGERSITSRLGKLYETSLYYHHDPNLKWIGKRNKDKSIPLLQLLHAKDISNASYRKNIYEDNGLLDRLSLIDHDHQRWFVFNLYRDVESGYFSDDEVNIIQDQADLIAALVKRHLSFSPAIGWDIKTIPPIEKLENIVAGLGGNLSKREIEVCARAMQGLTREAISLDLSIKQPTVATFMSRAYAKLDISSLNELFALCLARTSQIIHGS